LLAFILLANHACLLLDPEALLDPFYFEGFSLSLFALMLRASTAFFLRDALL
jgi:hypothetical protein